jgi:hypothetical protein
MLWVNFAPQLGMKQFIAWVSIVQIITFLICFIGSLVVYGDLSSTSFLGADAKVYRMFEKDAYWIKQF